MEKWDIETKAALWEVAILLTGFFALGFYLAVNI